LETLALPPFVSILKGVALKKLPKIQICEFLLETCTKGKKFQFFKLNADFWRLHFCDKQTKAAYIYYF
jgi:hypothetical protein